MKGLMNRALSLLLLGAALVCVSGCAQPAVPILSFDGPAAGPRIAVIVANDNPLYLQPVDGFLKGAGARAQVYSLQGKPDPRSVRQAITEFSPDLIFALGARASQFGRTRFASVPMVFAVVVNHQRIESLEHSQVMGIDFQVPPALEFVRYRMVMPKLQTVVAFYSPEVPKSSLEKTIQALKLVGITLRAVAVRSPLDLESKYQSATKDVDAVWYMSDPLLVNRSTFDFLKSRTATDKIALLAPFSEQLTEAGALMSVSVDFKSLGPQAAHIAKRVLFQNTSTATIGVEAPIGGKFTVNLATAKSLGLEIPKTALPIVNRFVK